MQKKELLQFGIAVFFFFHILAISVESIPQKVEGPFSHLIRSVWSPLTRPYVRFTGQWQDWNLFAPDPLTVAIALHIDEERDGEWQEKESLSPETLSFFRETTMLKFVRSLSMREEVFPLWQKQLLDQYCEDVPSDTRLRVRIRSSHFPYDSHNDDVGEDLICPS